MIEIQPGVLAVIVTVMLATIGAMVKLWFYFDTRVSQEQKLREDSLRVLSSRVEAVNNESSTRYGLVFQSLTDFKLEAAKTYVIYSDLKETELRLTGAMDKLSVQLDRVAARLETIVARMSGG